MQWVVNRKAAGVGCDTETVEAGELKDYPSGLGTTPPGPGYSFPGHQVALGQGVHLLENLDLDELAVECRARNRYVFTVIIQPMAVKGAATVTIAPVALL